jgi:hypothetical protein
MADADTGDGWARPLARWLMQRPEKIPMLQPAGKFHRKVFGHLLSHPKMTTELRSKLAEHNHLLGYML